MKQSVRKAGCGYATTRAQNKAAEKYDHAQFDDFCATIYTEGVKDGRASVPGADLTEIMAAIKAVKGIGEKRLAQIETAVAVLFEPEKGGA